ncbi:hypothetical protein PHMEG_00035993 [Phytophthora megakarya]|uniref:Reverse transcriptase n=1 Tax=Phytophthora megakarya TaxID=4795 RepID=A0A225UMI3_9STRA|nr:hypothetical protein PHMEG_00035993 [Phytophthora megakarya]
MIRHDRDPRLMGRVFKHFREMLGSRQRATLAYRPQANGQQERSVQTVVRSVKAYVQTVDQSDWDELAEKLMWALNTSFDFTRLDTPFYLVHGWDAQARVRPGLTKKLAHLWHGPFRIREKGSDFRYRLQVEGTEYRFHPWVHVSRLKPRAKYPERPSGTMDIPEDDDFDAALLREDSWEPDEGSEDYEVEAILDVRWITRTRTSRRVKEYLVKWKGYEAPDWIPQGRLNCGRLLYEFDQGERARVRFQAMQSGDELPDEEVR